ncbi:MAG: hypothetical protein ABI844_11585 [Saprospiraceae bacterium]
MTKVFVLMTTFFLTTIPVSAQDINFKVNLFQSTFTDEQWPGVNPRHQGYNVGFDVIINDGSTLIMPGMYFQKTSLSPEKFEIGNPFKEFTDVKTIKIPLQVGGNVFKNKFSALMLHGGMAATYLLGTDENVKLNEDDFNDLRGSLYAGATVRLLFFTVHVNYEYGLTRIYQSNGPSGLVDSSKEKTLSFGLGVYF